MIAKLGDKTPKIPASCFVAESADIIGDVTLGEHVSIWFQAVVRGDVHYIKIGDHTNVQDGCVLHVSQGIAPLNIGARVTIGHKALLHGCTIGNDCLIGMGSVILDHVEVGDGSIVAAGALLTPGKKFPPGSLILGSPAKAVRTVTEKERQEMIDQGWKNYFNYSQEYKTKFSCC